MNRSVLDYEDHRIVNGLTRGNKTESIPDQADTGLLVRITRWDANLNSWHVRK